MPEVLKYCHCHGPGTFVLGRIFRVSIHSGPMGIKYISGNNDTYSISSFRSELLLVPTKRKVGVPDLLGFHCWLHDYGFLLILVLLLLSFVFYVQLFHLLFVFCMLFFDFACAMLFLITAYS